MTGKETAQRLIAIFERLLAQGDGLCEELRFGCVAGSPQREGFAHTVNRGELIIFILSGTCRVEYLDVAKTRRDATLAPGTVLYLGQAPFSQFYDESCERVGVSVAGLRLGLSYHDFHEGEAYPNCPDIYLRGNLAGNTELDDLFTLLDKRARSPVERDELTCSLPRMIVLALLEYFRQTPRLRPENVDKLRWEQLRGYLEENYSKPLSRGSVAEKFQLSEDHLSRLFQKKTGFTFSQLLLKLRMERAKALLQGGGFSVKEVAYECGYRDFSYFTRAFKKYYNALPKNVLDQDNEYSAQDLSMHRRR